MRQFLYLAVSAFLLQPQVGRASAMEIETGFQLEYEYDKAISGFLPSEPVNLDLVDEGYALKFALSALTEANPDHFPEFSEEKCQEAATVLILRLKELNGEEIRTDLAPLYTHEAQISSYQYLLSFLNAEEYPDHFVDLSNKVKEQIEILSER